VVIQALLGMVTWLIVHIRGFYPTLLYVITKHM